MISGSQQFEIPTVGSSDVQDITAQVQQIVSKAGLKEGIATVFVPGSTASITTIEFESGAVSDLREAIRKWIPDNLTYRHDSRWGDGNGFSHIRSALMGPSLTVPVVQGQLALGTWQQIVLLDHDNRARKRKVVVQVMGNG